MDLSCAGIIACKKNRNKDGCGSEDDQCNGKLCFWSVSDRGRHTESSAAHGTGHITVFGQILDWCSIYFIKCFTVYAGRIFRKKNSAGEKVDLNSIWQKENGKYD